MKKILVKAYTAINLGDDLFIKMLCERYPNTQFYMNIPENYSKPYSQIENLKIIPRIKYIDGVLSKLGLNFKTNDFLVSKKIKQIDAIVHIGGSIFIESMDSLKKVKEYKKDIKKYDNYFIIGSNFGPYETEEFYQNYREAFKEVSDLCFRDQYSYNLFKDIENVRLAPDVVFALKTEKIKSENNRGTVIISIIDLTWREDLKKYINRYEQSIIDISKKIIEAGYVVKLMSFCKKEGDEKAAKRIKDAVSDIGMKTYFYDGNIDEILMEIKASEAVIATRFHAMILGFVLDIPTIPYIYSEKMSNVLNDINYIGESIKIKSEESVNIDNIIEQIQSGKKTNVQNQIRLSNDQFKILDEFLMN